jgi:hypothetical protein
MKRMNRRDTMHCVSTARRSVHAITVRLRAESPVINSTGQRPVGNNRPSTTSPERVKSGYLIRCRPFRAMGTGSPLFTGRCPVLLMTGLSARLTAIGRRQVVFGKRCNPCAVRHNMLVENTVRHRSRRPVRDGMYIFLPTGRTCGTQERISFFSTNMLCLCRKSLPQCVGRFSSCGKVRHTVWEDFPDVEKFATLCGKIFRLIIL